jgi:hypothetical protein
MQQLAAFLSSLSLGSSRSVAGLTVFPLLRQPAPEPWYDTLTEAVGAHMARVTEVSDAGRVPELQVVNDSPRHVLIVDGEELVGAKQNRIVNLTILVPPKTSLTIPVSCVEAGRWREVSREFTPAQHAYHSSGRRAKVEQVSMSLRSDGARSSDQSAIWGEIEMKSARMGSNSRTRAASAMYDNERHNLDKFVEGLPPQDWQVGAVFAIRGQIAGLDVFDSPRTWALLMPKLVRSYGLDALDRGIGGDGFAEPSPGRFLDAVSAAQCTFYPAVGAGRDLRVEGSGILGAALTTEHGVVHAVAFPAADVTHPRPRRGSFDRLRQ